MKDESALWEEAWAAADNFRNERNYPAQTQELGKALVLAERFGEQDSRLHRTLYKLAELYNDVHYGKGGEAHKIFKRLKRLLEKYPDTDKLLLAKLYHNKGIAERVGGSRKEAFKWFLKAAELRETLKPRPSEDVAEYWHDVGKRFSIDRSEYAQARDAYAKAVSEVEALHAQGFDVWQVCMMAKDAFESLAKATAEMGDAAAAEKEWLRYLKFAMQFKGRKHLTQAMFPLPPIYKGLGEIQIEQKKWKQAEASLLETLKIGKKESRYFQLAVRDSLMKVYLELGDTKNADKQRKSIERLAKR